MKIFKMRVKGDKEWQEREVSSLHGEMVGITDDDLEHEVRCFSEEWGLKEDDVIEIYRGTNWIVDNVWVEYNHEVKKIEEEQVV